MATTKPRKTAISQPAAKKPTGKKTASRQAAASKPAVKKPAAKRGDNGAGRKVAKVPARKMASGRTSASKSVAKKMPAKTAVSRKAAATKTAVKKAPAKQAVVKWSIQKVPTQPPLRKVATKAAAGKRPVATAASSSRLQASAKTAKHAASPRKITPKQALANTRSLLEAKHAHDREAPPWQALDTHSHGLAPKSGFQSEEAKDKAVELHAGESRLNAIEGSISTQDRHSQGKRDSR